VTGISRRAFPSSFFTIIFETFPSCSSSFSFFVTSSAETVNSCVVVFFRTEAPHSLQYFAFSARLAPQLLQVSTQICRASSKLKLPHLQRATPPEAAVSLEIEECGTSANRERPRPYPLAGALQGLPTSRGSNASSCFWRASQP